MARLHWSDPFSKLKHPEASLYKSRSDSLEIPRCQDRLKTPGQICLLSPTEQPHCVCAYKSALPLILHYKLASVPGKVLITWARFFLLLCFFHFVFQTVFYTFLISSCTLLELTILTKTVFAKTALLEPNPQLAWKHIKTLSNLRFCHMIFFYNRGMKNNNIIRIFI